MAAKREHGRANRDHADTDNRASDESTDGHAGSNRGVAVEGLERPPAPECGNCVFWLEPPPLPEAAEENADALRAARALGEMGGLCRFLPQSIRKQASDWCGQHRYRKLVPVE